MSGNSIAVILVIMFLIIMKLAKCLNKYKDKSELRFICVFCFLTGLVLMSFIIGEFGWLDLVLYIVALCFDFYGVVTGVQAIKRANIKEP